MLIGTLAMFLDGVRVRWCVHVYMHVCVGGEFGMPLRFNVYQDPKCGNAGRRLDKRGNWHIINHAYRNDEYEKCGTSIASAHFFSTDGKEWHWSTQPYTHTVGEQALVLETQLLTNSLFPILIIGTVRRRHVTHVYHAGAAQPSL